MATVENNEALIIELKGRKEELNNQISSLSLETSSLQSEINSLNNQKSALTDYKLELINNINTYYDNLDAIEARITSIISEA